MTKTIVTSNIQYRSDIATIAYIAYTAIEAGELDAASKAFMSFNSLRVHWSVKCTGARGGERMEEKSNLAAEATGISISEQDQRDIHDLYSKLRAAEAKLVGPDGKTQVLPGSLYSFLCQLLADLKDGKSVTILQSEATLTTVEAAKLLGVSRQFLIQEIERKKVPHHMVGTHRRLYARDVLAYKSNRDAGRRTELDDLALAEHEEGPYSRGLNDPHSRQ
jgi:excisionase family DNA binding protein